MTDCDVNKSRTINPSGSAAPGVQRDGTCDSLPSDGSSCCIVTVGSSEGAIEKRGQRKSDSQSRSQINRLLQRTKEYKY